MVKRKKEKIREDFCLGTIRYYDEFGKALDEGYSFMYVCAFSSRFKNLRNHFIHSILYCRALYTQYIVWNHKDVIIEIEVREKQEK